MFEVMRNRAVGGYKRAEERSRIHQSLLQLYVVSSYVSSNVTKNHHEFLLFFEGDKKKPEPNVYKYIFFSNLCSMLNALALPWIAMEAPRHSATEQRDLTAVRRTIHQILA